MANQFLEDAGAAYNLFSAPGKRFREAVEERELRELKERKLKMEEDQAVLENTLKEQYSEEVYKTTGRKDFAIGARLGYTKTSDIISWQRLLHDKSKSGKLKSQEDDMYTAFIDEMNKSLMGDLSNALNQDPETRDRALGDLPAKYDAFQKTLGSFDGPEVIKKNYGAALEAGESIRAFTILNDSQRIGSTVDTFLGSLANSEDPEARGIKTAIEATHLNKKFPISLGAGKKEAIIDVSGFPTFDRTAKLGIGLLQNGLISKEDFDLGYSKYSSDDVAAVLNEKLSSQGQENFMTDPSVPLLKDYYLGKKLSEMYNLPKINYAPSNRDLDRLRQQQR